MKKKPTYEELEQRVRDLEAKLSEENVEWAILKRLSQEWDTAGPPGILDNRDLLASLNITADEALPALQKLVKFGIIDKDELGFASFLTPEGYTFAKKGRPDSSISEQFRPTR